MIGLIDTTEMYLRTLAELLEQDITPLRARIAERLNQSTPTVSQTVARMERDGLLTLDDERQIMLSDVGRQQAVRVLRRHRVAECFLEKQLGLDLYQAHDEACRWEHVITDDVELRMWRRLGGPAISPYGCPIPGIEELGTVPEIPFLTGVISLAQAVAQGRSQVRVLRLSEDAQRWNNDLVQVLDAGIRPGVTVQLKPLAKGVQVSGTKATGTANVSGTIVLQPALTEAIYVAE